MTRELASVVVVNKAMNLNQRLFIGTAVTHTVTIWPCRQESPAVADKPARRGV